MCLLPSGGRRRRLSRLGWRKGGILADITRRIGLSLGADLCWPTFYEDIIGVMNPQVSTGGDSIRFDIDRLTIEPYDLAQPVEYDVVLDRLTHWYHTSREWIKKAVVKDGLYVLNNPFSIQAMEKHTSYAAMMRLGMPIPTTWMVPPKHYQPSADLQITLESYAQHFDLGEVGRAVGFPMFMKPFDGGAWVGVSRAGNEDELREAYEESGVRLMHLQEAIEPFDLFVRALAVGPQVNVLRYDPAAPLHDRYKVDFNFVDADEWSLLSDMVLTINTFFGWDFNSCEALASRRSVSSHRFRQSLPGFAGDVTPLSHSLAGQGQDPVVALLRSHQTTRCG